MDRYWIGKGSAELTEIGLEMNWHAIGTGFYIGTGNRLAQDWEFIDVGLTSDWGWIDTKFASDWHWIDVRLVLDRHWIGTGLAALTSEWYHICNGLATKWRPGDEDWQPIGAGLVQDWCWIGAGLARDGH